MPPTTDHAFRTPSAEPLKVGGTDPHISETLARTQRAEEAARVHALLARVLGLREPWLSSLPPVCSKPRKRNEGRKLYFESPVKNCADSSSYAKFP